jgi:hypothetical protein
MDAGNGKLGIGLGFGMINSSLEADWVSPDGNPAGDPSIPERAESIFTLDFSAGLFYYTEDLYLGFSTTHINAIPQLSIPLVRHQPFLRRHYYLTSGYGITARNPSTRLLPAVHIQSDGVQ